MGRTHCAWIVATTWMLAAAGCGGGEPSKEWEGRVGGDGGTSSRGYGGDGDGKSDGYSDPGGSDTGYGGSDDGYDTADGGTGGSDHGDPDGWRDGADAGAGDAGSGGDEESSGAHLGRWNLMIVSADIHENRHSDVGTDSDAKANVTVEEETASTSVAWDDWTPTWDETLFEDVPGGSLTAFTVEMVDHDRATRDDLIGECDFTIARSRFEAGEAFTVIRSCSAFDVVVTFSPSDVTCTNTCEYAHDSVCDDGRPGAGYDLCAPGTDCTDCSAGGESIVDPRDWTWELRVDHAEIHENTDLDWRSGSDPKVKVSVEGDTRATSAVYDDTSPEWYETLFTDKTGHQLTRLSVEVVDYDRGTRDDPIGKCSMTIDSGDFADGKTFTTTESCEEVFDITFTFTPR